MPTSTWAAWNSAANHVIVNGKILWLMASLTAISMASPMNCLRG